MTAFWLGAAAMVGAALLIVLRPLLFPRDPKDPGAEESEIAVYRERLRELRQDVARGALTEADSEKAERELQAAFARDTAAAVPTTGPRRAQRHWITAAVIGLGLPLVSLLLYERIGAREEVGLILANERAAEAEAEHLRAIAQRYEAEVTAAPGDAKAWMALGRAYLALGEAGKAMEALGRAQVLLGDEPDLLADYAKAMAQAQGGRFDGGPWRLLERALAKDPDHPMTLWLAAAASLEREDRPQARAYLERLRAQLEPGSEGEKMVQAHLAMLGEGQAGPATGGEAVAAEGQPASPSTSGQSPACPAPNDSIATGRGDAYRGPRRGPGRAGWGAERAGVALGHRVRVRPRPQGSAHAAGRGTASGQGPARDDRARRHPGDGPGDADVALFGGPGRGSRVAFRKPHAADRGPRRTGGRDRGARETTERARHDRPGGPVSGRADP